MAPSSRRRDFLKAVERILMRRTTTWVAIGIALAAWSLIGAEVWMHREDKLREARTTQRNLAATIAEETERTMEFVDQLAWSVRRDLQLGRAVDDLRSFIAPRHRQSDLIIQIALLDREGWMVNSSVPWSRVFNGDRDYFRQIASQDIDNPVISRPLVDRNTKQLSVQFVRRIEDSTGHFAGAVVVSLNPLYFSNRFKRFDLGRGSVFLLFGQDGVTRGVHPEGLINVGDSLNKLVPPSQYRGFAVGDLTMSNRQSDDPVLLSYRALSSYPLIIGVGKSHDALYADADAERAWPYVIGGSVLAMLPLFSLLVYRRLRARIAGQRGLLRVGFERRREGQRRVHDLFTATTRELESKLEAHRALIYATQTHQAGLRDGAAAQAADSSTDLAETISASTDMLIDLVRTQSRLLDLLFVGPVRFEYGSAMSVAVLARGMLRQQLAARNMRIELDPALGSMVCRTDLILLKDIFFAILLALVSSGVLGDRISIVRLGRDRICFRLLAPLPTLPGGDTQQPVFHVPALRRQGEELAFAARLAERLGCAILTEASNSIELDVAGLVADDTAGLLEDAR